jgi:hypothetical protein
VEHLKGILQPYSQISDLIGYQGTNTLAYHKHSLITTVKSFITLGPGLRPVACADEEHMKGAPLGKAPSLPENIRLGCKCKLGANTLAYLSFIRDEGKSFIAFGYRSLMAVMDVWRNSSVLKNKLLTCLDSYSLFLFGLYSIET